MSYKEFNHYITPYICEIEEECRKLKEGEFDEYRKEVMQEIREKCPQIGQDFMDYIFDMIHERVFSLRIV